MTKETKEFKEKTSIRKNTIIFLGDSITDAGRFYDKDGLGNGYVRLLADRIGGKADLINRGKDGFTAYQIDRYLSFDCLEHKPDLVSILVGINDLSAYLGGAGGYDAVEYKKILDRILARILASGTRQILVMEPFLFPEPAEYQRWMPACEEFARSAEKSAQKTGAIFLPLRKIFAHKLQKFPVSSLTTDGIHLTHPGHEILADSWFSLIRNSLPML